ncbi:MAG: hypothetical protein C0502_04865 [Opitutus sp.]|nr:hypothetical protein [Opitutus sp.]
MRLPGFLLLVLAALCAGGCAQISREGHGDLGRFRRVFVEQRQNDNIGAHRMIVDELQTLGYEADSGWLTMMPVTTDLVVTYDVRETWDFRPYVIELNVAVRPAKDYNRVVATARYFRPGVTNKPAAAMVRELMRKLFPPVRR